MKEKNSPKEQYIYPHNPFLASVWSTVDTESVHTQSPRLLSCPHMRIQLSHTVLSPFFLLQINLKSLMKREV